MSRTATVLGGELATMDSDLTRLSELLVEPRNLSGIRCIAMSSCLAEQRDGHQVNAKELFGK